MNATYALFTFQLVAFIILVLLMHDLYRKLRRDSVARAEPRGPESAQLKAGVDEMVAELRRAADRINADIQARASTLQKLVDEADHRMRQLDAAVARAEAGRGAPRRAEPTRQAAPPQPAPARPAPRPAAPRRPIEAPRIEATVSDEPLPGAPTGEPTRTLPHVAPASGAAANAYRQATRVTASPPARSPNPQPPTPDPHDDGFMAVGLDDAGKFQTVRRLANQGLSAAEIARATRMGREEVELIMQLSGEARP